MKLVTGKNMVSSFLWCVQIYDMMDYINVRPKAQKKRSGREVRGVSPEAGMESMRGKICGRGTDH